MARPLGALEELLEEAHGVVQVEGVLRPHRDVELAHELRPQGRPVPLQDRREVVVLAPVAGDGGIDLTGPGLPERGRIPVGSDRAEDGMEGVHLAARAAPGSEHVLLVAEVRHRGEQAAVSQPSERLREAAERADVEVGVLLVVEVHEPEGVEVHGVGAEAPGPAEVVGIEDLLGEGHPPAGRAAEQHAGPGRPDRPKAPLDLRIQLLRERVAVGTHVGGVHAVGVVVVGRGVLGQHHEHLRQAAGAPLLEEAVGVVLATARLARRRRRRAASRGTSESRRGSGPGRKATG